MLFALAPAFAKADTYSNQMVTMNLDDLWVLVAAALVFFMQAGFKVLETGLVKKQHRAGIGAKNLLDWVAGSIAFFVVGFGIMFGSSDSAWFGFDFFAGNNIDTGKEYIFFLFQLAFTGTALTIVSGAMSGRTGVIPYFIASMMTAMVIYPVFGYWSWGNLLIEDNTPWLAGLGFMDFAGSTVVHSTGAWIAVVGIYMVGPRIGRYDALGKLQKMPASDYSYSILGVMILWLGWWGFNGGSTLAFNEDVVKIILNTNLAGAAAAFTAFFYAVFFQDKQDVIEKLAGGSLTGLVAITACCNVVSPISAILIGAIAGIIHNLFYVYLSENLKLDDPVGAIAVHGIGGIFGTLAVALFGEADLLVHDRWLQLGIQVVGIITCFGFTTVISLGMFILIKKTIGLRVSPLEEMKGAFVGQIADEMNDEVDENRKVTQVAVQISARGYNMYSIEEYLKIEQDKRSELVRHDKVKYMDQVGNIMSPLIAVRQLGQQLENEKHQIEEERDKLIEEQKQTTKNISHASKLQSALLGSIDTFQNLFEESMIYFKPKIKVSGDFYWFKKIGTYKIVLCCNSTGSGVSGGFLSILGMSMINEIFSSNKVLYPEKVLDIIDRKFVKTLRAKSLGQQLMDKLDMSIIVIDELKQELHFAGANSNLYIGNDGALKEFLGNNCSIGRKDMSNDSIFKRESIKYKTGDIVYLFTNGYYDQKNLIGEPITKEVLLDILKTNMDKSFVNQQRILKEDFDNWSTGAEQTDDVLIMGFKLR